jgi:two-component system response regulator AtoC
MHSDVLLVDDNRDGLLVRRALLEEQGIPVQIADNPEDGLRLFKSKHYAVVVTDYRMPRMLGTELIERLRQIDPNVRVILVSTLVEPLGLTEENTGADAVIAKNSREPVHLVRAVKRMLNRASQRKPPRSEAKTLTRARVTAR